MKRSIKKAVLSLGVVVALVIGALAMPTKEEMSEAQPLVNELMTPLANKYKSGKMSAVEVGDGAMAYFAEAEGVAAKFVLLKWAASYYATGKEYDKAADTVEAIMKLVPDIPSADISAITSKAMSKTTEKKAPRLAALNKVAKSRIAMAAHLKAVEQEISSKPHDAELLRTHAELLAATGDWKSALPEFAKLGGKIGQMATGENDESSDNAALADFWWSYTPLVKNTQDTFRGHAAEFYRKAVDNGELTGLKKTVAEKRLAELEVPSNAMLSSVVTENNGSGESQKVLSVLKRLGAKKVEYLGGTGSGRDYIDTGIVGKSEIRVDFEVSHWTADWFCFGERNSKGSESFIVGRVNPSKMYFDYNLRLMATVNTDTTSKYRIVKDRQRNYCYDSKGVVIYSGTNPPAKFNSGLTMYIFTANLGGNPKTNSGDARRFYYFKIWDNDVLVRDFIPVRVGSTGYLFDRVSLKLFGNNGPGAFIVGPDL